MNVTIEPKYDRFLSVGSWIAVLFNAVPAAALLGAMVYFDVNENLWTPVLVVFAIGSLSFALNYGFVAVNIQIRESVDWLGKSISKIN